MFHVIISRINVGKVIVHFVLSNKITFVNMIKKKSNILIK